MTIQTHIHVIHVFPIEIFLRYFDDRMKFNFGLSSENQAKALKKADLIILAGVSADFRLNYGRR